MSPAEIARLHAAPAADAPSAPPERSPRIDWLPLAAVLALGVAGAAFIRLGVLDRVDRLEAALAQRPPVAVIDYGAIQEALAAGATPAELHGSFAAVKERAEALRARGFLVINRAAVETAPEALVVQAAPVLMAPRAAPGPAPAPAAPPPAAARPAEWGPRSAMSDAEAAAVLRALLGGAAPDAESQP
jgi:hypothetical protein